MRHLSKARFYGYFSSTVVIIILFIFLDFNFSKVLFLSTDFSTPTSYIGVLTPTPRVNNQQIVQEPVYFKVRLPRPFSQVEVVADIDPDGPDIVRLGLMNKGVPYQLKTLRNSFLDQLNWPISRKDGLVYWTRPGLDWQNIDDSKIATYDYDYIFDWPLAEPSENDQVSLASNFKEVKNYPLTFQGGQSFYLKQPQGRFNFSLRASSSQGVSGQEVYLRAYNQQGQQVFESGLQDGRLILQASYPWQILRLEVVAPNDVFFDDLQTNAWQWVWLDRIHLAAIDENIDLVTTAHTLVLLTKDYQGLQKIVINEQNYSLDETYHPYKFKLLKSVNDVKLKQGFLEVAGRGVYALSKDLLFSPKAPSLESLRSLDDVDQIISKYDPQGHLILDLPANHQLEFIISSPGVSPINPLKINRLNLNFTRQNLDIKEYLKVWIDRFYQIF